MDFSWDHSKHSASLKTLCKTFPVASPSFKIAKVVIRATNDSDENVGWPLKTVFIQSYPSVGSSFYESYSLAPPEPRFWVSSNEKCEEVGASVNSFPCCTNGKWCRLYSRGTYTRILNGNLCYYV